ncbi:transcriptional regulator, TetR family [Geodermatophilus saharensis]|uniref:Transcriptional regulator, TetR family n=1 Tax=Geodermatophilus saharensis TaxID=1137994 RepID=A0A239F1Y8_9ACTN|nr:TetR/AcrR family transcriptional regulator [Geodermatophilus saharensis]SNS50731.1 transcriptional regulator, TetR family [Geodermatophilus saharensis]
MATESTSGGDPARTMALLWRSPDGAGRRPGPRPGLDVDRVVAAAVELADREGLAAVTVRRLAAELGVGAMTLYTHVPGKGELVALMHDAVLGELYPEPPAGDWRARLTAVARANWDLYVRHPWAASVGTGRPVLGPNLMRRYDLELAAVDGLGLSEVEMELVVTVVGGFVRGTVGGLHDKDAAERDSGLTEDEWWAATEPLVDRVFDAARFPTAARVGPVAGNELGGYSPERTFEFGLARLLDGIAVLVER